MRGTALLGLKRAVLFLLILRIFAAPITLKRPAHDHSTRTWWVVRVWSWSADSARSSLEAAEAVQVAPCDFFWLVTHPIPIGVSADGFDLVLIAPSNPRLLESMKC